MKADFGKTASDYRKHRAGFPGSFFNQLREHGIIQGNEKIVDLGTGTGTVARGLAAMGCQSTGVDPSSELLTQAAKMALEDGLSVEWKQGTAESTGLEDGCADVVTAGQCWHWFDPKKAVHEVKRLLKKDGLLLIAHFDWLPIRRNVVWHTERLIKASQPNWNMDGGIGVYPEWYRHMYEGGFSDIKSFTYHEAVSYTHEAWMGRIRASAGVGGSMSPEEVEAFDQKHKQLLIEQFPADPLSIPHQIFVIHGRK